MKKLLGKLCFLFSLISKALTALIHFIVNSPIVRKYKASVFHKFHVYIWEKHPVLMHIPTALLMCFNIEWLSKHSFVDAIFFVIHHTGPYLYNSFIIFAVFSLVFLSSRRQFMRILITFFFAVLGVTNCIVLLNRVTPFGYTDLSMISDLLTMTNTQYFTAEQAMLVVIALFIFIILMGVMFVKGEKVELKKPLWMRISFSALMLFLLFPTTLVLRETGILTSYFGNLAQGYRDYGFLYGFSTSVFDRGMSRPFNYSQASIDKILKQYDAGENSIDEEHMPNIVVILLESIYDVSECKFLETDQDPIPYLHYLEENYSTGHCIVPVVGAGTCNSEFEVLTGMSCSFLGPGEYPQKTILKETSCESYADVLGELGYGTHVVHNNGGNFYSRANAFSQMGFDTFTCKEMLDITDYTPLGSWPTDDILIEGTMDSMDRTEGSDFIYTITVQSHGAYPEYEVETDPAIKVNAEGKSEGMNYAWSYYVNRTHDEDEFIRKYIEALDSRGEDTLVIMFGDHLPTMGLNESEVSTGDLYQTKYFTWNNFGMEKQDKDLTTYQLVSEYLGRLGIRNGNLNSYHQVAMAKGKKYGTLDYMKDLEAIQYDLLYGQKYTYHTEDLYPASDIEMGVNDVKIDSGYFFNGKFHIYGDYFTKWSKVYVNGEKVPTTYESGQVLTISDDLVKNGDIVTICQVGSSNTVFRESNQYTVFDPYYDPSLENDNVAESDETIESDED